MAWFTRFVAAGILAGLALMGAGPVHAEATPACTASCPSSRSRRTSATRATAGEPPTTVPAATTTASTLEPLGGDAPSIIRKPGEERNRPSNDLGFIIGLGMFVGWIGTGALMFRRAARRRAAGHPAGGG